MIIAHIYKNVVDQLPLLVFNLDLYNLSHSLCSFHVLP